MNFVNTLREGEAPVDCGKEALVSRAKIIPTSTGNCDIEIEHKRRGKELSVSIEACLLENSLSDNLYMS